MNAAPFLSGAALLGLTLVLPGAGPQDRQAGDKAPRSPPGGFYLILRQGAKAGDVGPARAGERIIVDRHRYEKESKEPPRYLAVHQKPDVPLAIDGAVKGIPDDAGSLRIQFRLKADAAGKLKRLTSKHQGSEVAIVLGGEVVSSHKIRSVIADGRVQITCCVPGSCERLLEDLQKAVSEK